MGDRRSTEYIADSLARGSRHVNTRRRSAGPHSSIFHQQSKRASGQQDEWRFTSPRPYPNRADEVNHRDSPSQSNFERRWSAIDFAGPRDQSKLEKVHPLRAISANPRMHPSREPEGHTARSISKSAGMYKFLNGQILEPAVRDRPRLSETLPSRDARHHRLDPPLYLHDRDPVGWIEHRMHSSRSKSNMELQKDLSEAQVALRAKECELRSMRERVDLYKWRERQNRTSQPIKNDREESLRWLARRQSAPPPGGVSSQPEYLTEMVENVRNQLAADSLIEAGDGRNHDENSMPPSQFSETVPGGMHCSYKDQRRGLSIDSRSPRQDSNPFTRTESRGDSGSWKIGCQPVARENSLEEELRVSDLADELPAERDYAFGNGWQQDARAFLERGKDKTHTKEENINSSRKVHHASWINSNFPTNKSITENHLQAHPQSEEELGVPPLDVEGRRHPITNHQSRSNEFRVQKNETEPSWRKSCDGATYFNDVGIQADSFDRSPEETRLELEWKAKVTKLEAEVMMAMCKHREVKAANEKIQASWEEQRAADQKEICALREEIARREEIENQLRMEADRRLKDFETFKGDYARVSEELSHLENNQFKHIREQLAKTSQDRNELGSLVMDREDKIKKLTNSVEKLGHQNAELERELGDSRWQVQSLEEDRLRLLTITSDLEKDQEMRQLEIEKLKGEKQALVAFNKSEEEDEQLLSTARDELTQQIEMLQKDLGEAKDSIGQAEAALNDKDDEITFLKQQLADVTAKQKAQMVSSKAAFGVKSGDPSQHLAAEVERLTKLLEEKDLDRAEDQETILDLQQLQVAKAKEMEDAVRKLENELRKKQSALERSEALQKKLLKHTEQSPRMFSGLLEEENETLKQKLIERDEEMEEMRENHRKKARVYEEAEDNIACLEADIDQWRRDYKGVSKSKVKLEQENKSMKERLHKLTFECGGSPMKRIRDLQQSLAQERKQSEILRKTVMDLQQELADREEVGEGENPSDVE